ncbi:acyl carrier protein [Vibrio breoganii]
MNTYVRVINVLSGFFNLEASMFNETTVADDIEGWDSLSHAEVLITLEKEFEITFNLGDMMSMNNVGELVVLIDRKL